ncbi:MAG: polysaccharide deacetylase family protein [Chloroflexi bacterium]|nr:polysaccharide deacetylase family protein [Chloroflexota bacterium]
MKKVIIPFLLLTIAALAACGGKTAQPAAETLVESTAVPAPTHTNDPTQPPPPTPTATAALLSTSVPTVDPAIAHLVGTYRFHAARDAVTADYFLTLNSDGAALFQEQPIGDGDLVTEATGNWYLDGEYVLFDLLEIGGQPAGHEEIIRFTFSDGFPVVADIKINDQFVHLENNAFTLGAGESNPLVAELNRRLAAIDYLGFTDPGMAVYGEESRTAVAAFQESQGLIPTGVVDAQTWVLLDNPQPPVPTPTPLPVLTDVPNLDDLPTHTADGRPILYLTFDDGPQPGNTEPLLDLFDQYDAKVTFFNVGTGASAWPELVRESASRGHYIADHTWDHTSLEGMSREQFVDEVERTRQAILDAAGDLFSLDRNVRYVRPPYGATDANTRAYAADLGMTVVLWTVDPQDWRRPGADVIANHILTHASPGAIILSHDGGGDRSQTVAAYQTVLPQLAEQGYVFRTIFLP